MEKEKASRPRKVAQKAKELQHEKKKEESHKKKQHQMNPEGFINIASH